MYALQRRLLAILFWVGASAASLAEKFQPGVPYYFENFDPAMKPWDPGQDLNIEEVFKNYVYYEIIFDQIRPGDYGQPLPPEPQGAQRQVSGSTGPVARGQVGQGVRVSS